MRMMSGIHLILIPAGFLIIDDIHIPADLPHVHGNAQACGKARHRIDRGIPCRIGRRRMDIRIVDPVIDVPCRLQHPHEFFFSREFAEALCPLLVDPRADQDIEFLFPEEFL